MLQINRIREEKANVIAALAKRHFDAEETVNSLLETNDSKKSTQQKAEGLKAEANGIAKQIGGLYKEGKREAADKLKGRSSEIKEELKGIQDELNVLADKEFELLVSLPNAPHESVVAGRNEEDNVEVKRVGEIPTLIDGAVPHWDLTSRYKLIDFELGVKITTGFDQLFLRSKYRSRLPRIHSTIVCKRSFWFRNWTVARQGRTDVPHARG
jgi:seryl-tRNA synthetase